MGLTQVVNKSAHAKLALACSVSAICLMTSFGAVAQTCFSFVSQEGQPSNVGGANLSIDRFGNVVATVGGKTQIVASVQPLTDTAGTAQLYGLNRQPISGANGQVMAAANAAAGDSIPSITTTEVSTGLF
jgi:hypothetical protein